jgi:hypothetical protein
MVEKDRSRGGLGTSVAIGSTRRLAIAFVPVFRNGCLPQNNVARQSYYVGIWCALHMQRMGLLKWPCEGPGHERKWEDQCGHRLTLPGGLRIGVKPQTG